MVKYEYDIHAFNVMNIQSCALRKHASDLPEVAVNRRQKDAQAKANKRQSDKLFLRKETEARTAKHQSDELLRRREAEARATKQQSHSLQDAEERRQREAQARKR